jgi:hypothetical protein
VKTYDKRHCVETEKYEICFGADIGKSNRVELSNNNGADCTCTSTDVDTFCTDVCWKDLCMSASDKEGEEKQGEIPPCHKPKHSVQIQ